MTSKERRIFGAIAVSLLIILSFYFGFLVGDTQQVESMFKALRSAFGASPPTTAAKPL